MAALLETVAASACRGDFARALGVLAPRLRRPLPPLESFYDFVADQDLLHDNPRHPRLTPAQLAAARRGLSRLKPGPLRSLLSSYALICARRYLPAARSAAAARGGAEQAQASLLEACALWLLCDSRRSRRWLLPALARADRAVALDPSRRALLLRAQIRFELEDNEKGLDDLARILRRDPDDASVRIGRSEILADLFRYRPALRELRRVLGKGPARWWFFAQRGRLRGMCGLLLPALRDLSEAARRQPGRGAVLAWRAEVLRKLGRYGESRRDLDRAVTLDPGYAFGWECRGRLRLMLGESRAALSDLDRACRLDPAHTLAFAWRAEARLRLGLLRGAWADMERVYPLEPLNAWNSGTSVEGKLPERAERQASYWRTLDAAVARFPDDGVAWLLRGRAYATTGRQRPALSDLTRAHRLLEAGPAALRAAALAWRGKALMDLGANHKAAQDLESADALAPRARRWKAWLGTALLRLGRRQEALPRLAAALKRPEAGLTEAFLERGRFLASEGQLGRAREDFRAACLFEPKSSPARQALAALPLPA